jgi:cytochrome d ubiquinol oxidase subunit I
MTGDKSAYQVAQCQPMKLAAMEALYDGGTSEPLTVVGDIKIPKMLSYLATHDFEGYVPGINNILLGGYMLPDGTTALSAAEKITKGKEAIAALADYREAKQAGKQAEMDNAREILEANMPYFGYGYIEDSNSLVPNVWLLFWAFRVMVGLGMYFIAFFALVLFLSWKRKLSKFTWLHYVSLVSIPLAYIAGQAGWIVAEVGRQPWTIQDLLPVNAAISHLETGSVVTTFFIFLILFTVLLLAEIGIMLKAIQKGPEKGLNVK